MEFLKELGQCTTDNPIYAIVGKYVILTVSICCLLAS